VFSTAYERGADLQFFFMRGKLFFLNIFLEVKKCYTCTIEVLSFRRGAPPPFSVWRTLDQVRSVHNREKSHRPTCICTHATNRYA
jgi:hypothetical protein